jgi:hypothetical protein
MDKLYPIIRRKRRPLLQEDTEILKTETLKPERLPPVAVVPLVAAVPEFVPESVPDGPITKPKKSRDVATKN